MTMTLAEAKTVVEAAIAKAHGLDQRVSIVVCDANGRFIALNRMDGTYATATHSAMGKAIATVAYGRPSGDAGPTTGDLPQAATVMGEGMPVVRRRGGLPIFRAGSLVGGCGVCGAADDETDELCARAGLQALGGREEA